MINIPPEWSAILPAVYAIRTIIELARHPSPVRGAVVLVALAVVLYFGVDPVTAIGWQFKPIWGAVVVRTVFNTLLLGGLAMDGHDVIKRVAGG